MLCNSQAGKNRRKPGDFAATARAKADKVLALERQGKGASEIAELTRMGRASVYIILGLAG